LPCKVYLISVATCFGKGLTVALPIRPIDVASFLRCTLRYFIVISLVKPTRCTILEFIEYYSTWFGRSFRPSSGVQDCTHSIRYMLYRFVDSGQSTNLYDIPDAVCTALNS